MLVNCGVGEDSWESLGQQGDSTSPSWKKSVLNIHWKHWRWRWNSNCLATWWEELTHLKRPWFWEILKAGEGENRGWDGWMASLTQWTWVWASSGNWWWTGKPGVLQSMRLQRVRHDWVTELNTLHEFSRPEYWSGSPFPSPGDLPNSGIEPGSPALQADFFTNSANREAEGQRR